MGFFAKFGGVCASCKGKIAVGEYIQWESPRMLDPPSKRIIHVNCPVKLYNVSPNTPVSPDRIRYNLLEERCHFCKKDLIVGEGREFSNSDGEKLFRCTQHQECKKRISASLYWVGFFEAMNELVHRIGHDQYCRLLDELTVDTYEVPAAKEDLFCLHEYFQIYVSGGFRQCGLNFENRVVDHIVLNNKALVGTMYVSAEDLLDRASEITLDEALLKIGSPKTPKNEYAIFAARIWHAGEWRNAVEPMAKLLEAAASGAKEYEKYVAKAVDLFYKTILGIALWWEDLRSRRPLEL